MTLGRLILAWLPVAALFAISPPLGYPWTLPDAARAVTWKLNRWEIGWRIAEAAVLTLFASLWFDSLGSSGWVILFFLVGLLVAFPRRLVMWQHVAAPRRFHLLAHSGLDVVRYVVAGGLLAWRLA